MSLVVTDAKGLLDHPGYSGSRPYLSNEAIVLGSLGEEGRDLGKLCLGQPWSGTGGRMTAKSLYALLPCPLDPLADSSLAHAKGLGDVDLLPALLLQFPGSEATTFLPVFRFDRCCGAHAPSIRTSKTMFTTLCSGQ